MSDLTPAAPPPPPPPSSPPGERAPQFDFARPFAFVFEDPRWVTKVLVGGLFFFLAFLLIGFFFLMGYMARLARNVIAGMLHPLPEWDDLGEYFVEGFQLCLIGLVYMLPLLILGLGFVVPAALVDHIDNEGLRNVGGCVMGSAWCVLVPLSLAITFFVPGAMLRAVVERRMGAAFEFAAIWQFIRANIGNYLLAIVIYLVARFVAGFGFLLLCVGIIFTEFWALVATTYAFAQVYRVATKR